MSSGRTRRAPRSGRRRRSRRCRGIRRRSPGPGHGRGGTRLRARRSPAGRNDGRRYVRTPTSATARKLAISASRPSHDPGVHDVTAVIRGNVIGQYLGHGVPVAGREVGPEALLHLACRVFQSRRLRLQFIEAGERGVEVCLVEEFAAVDQIAVDRQKFDHSPFGIEALLRSALRRMGDRRLRRCQPMHSLDAEGDVWRERPHGRKSTRETTWSRSIVGRRWSTLTQSGVVAEARAG